MKKITIISILCFSFFSLKGQINITAKVTHVNRNSIEFIYTNIKNNSTETIQIEDGGQFESEFNSISEYSSLSSDFSGYSNNLTLVCKRQDYPLSLPYGNQRLTIRIKAGESYTTFTRLFTVGSIRGIFDNSYASSLKYLDAKIHLICTLESMSTMKAVDITTNRISLDSSVLADTSFLK